MAAWEALLTQLADTSRSTVSKDAHGEEKWVWADHLSNVQCLLQRGSGRRNSYDPGRHTQATWTLFCRASVDIQEDDLVSVVGVPERFKVTFVHRYHWRGTGHHIEATLERLFQETTAVALASGNGHAG
jgi:hypothetical protein